METARARIACGVEDAMNFNRVIGDRVDHDVGKTGNDKLSRARDFARPGRKRVPLKTRHGADDASYNAIRRGVIFV